MRMGGALMASPGQSAVAHLTNLAQTSLQQKVGYLLTAAVVVALVAGAWMWGQTPDYRVLYSNLNDRDGGAVIGALQQMNIPYKFADGGGAVMVPSSQVHEARLRLASQGLPKGSTPGFELMETQKFGVSQFVEQVNYQRALEGELARSIQSLAAVQSARVHLALAKQSVFVRDQQKPSASVLVNLYPGRNIEAAQVAAIVHLVASSVPDLPVNNVTVVDQQGTLLSADRGAPNAPGLDPTQLKYVRDVEAGYVKRIENILTPITGPGNVRAQVTAEVDFSETENLAETYKPNQNPTESAVRSQQTSESSSANGQGAAAGVPGAMSNQPPTPGSAPLNPPASAAATTAPAPAAAGATPAGGAPAAAAGATAASTATPQTPVNVRKDATVNYEVDKTIRHTRQAVGGIKRLSVAVVVNHHKEVDAEGKTTLKPLTDEEKTQIGDLVKEVMGYNKERGDTLNVLNSPFSVEEREPAPDVPLWQRPETINLVKDVGKHGLIAALVLYLVLGVLRPLLKSFAQPAPQVVHGGKLLPGQAPGADPNEPPPMQAVLSYEQHLASAKQLAQQNPSVVANVVKGWVQGNG